MTPDTVHVTVLRPFRFGDRIVERDERVELPYPFAMDQVHAQRAALVEADAPAADAPASEPVQESQP